MIPDPDRKMPTATDEPRISASDSHFSLAHAVEVDIRRELMSRDDWSFQSLVVHRMKDGRGICLQGVLECDDDDNSHSVCELVREIAGVTDVLDQLVVQRKAKPAVSE